MIEYITYKGETYPIRVSYYALSHFQKETGKEIESIDTDLTLLEPLLWFALIAGAKNVGNDLKLKREDVEFILDESMTEFLVSMAKFFPTPEAGSKVAKKKKS